MTTPPLRICVADHERRVDAMLVVDSRDDADVPFSFGQDFPFVDRGVAEIHVGRAIGALDRAGQLQFLLECRRVLAPKAQMHMTLPADGAARESIARLAGMAGLATAPPKEPGGMSFAKPVRHVHGEPLVSIAIPAYSPRFFAAALDSALAQTYANLEIVICDDSRDDAIASIVRSRAPRRPVPVRYLRNESRLGPRANYVACFDRSNGEFIKYLADDDLLTPDAVTRLMDAFRRVPDLTLATSRRYRIDADTTVLPDQPATMPIVDKDRVIAGVSLANAMLMVGLNMIGEPSTVLFRKSDLADGGPTAFEFDGAPGRGVIDMVMWTSLLLKGDAVYLLQPQSGFRVHADQRQQDPEVGRKSIASIRELQAAWLALGLHRRRAPHMLGTRDYPPDDDGDWVERQVTSFKVAG